MKAPLALALVLLPAASRVFARENAAVGAAPASSGGGHGQLPAGDAAEEEPREGG